MSARRAGPIAAALALAACSVGDPPRHFVLGADAAAPPAAVLATPRPLRVAVGPASVPEAIDRPQLVTRVGASRYLISEGERWAEPLKRAIPRVLARDLAALLAGASVAAADQHGGVDADYRVLIDVERIDAVAGEGVTMELTWSLRARSGDRLLERRSQRVEAAGAGGTEALVAALGRGLSGVAGEIAEAVAAVAVTPR